MKLAGVLAAASVLMVLSACASEPALPPGLTDAQLVTLAQPSLDAQWNAAQPFVGGEGRPSVEKQTFVAPDSQATVVSVCLAKKGFSTGTAMVFTADGEILQTAPFLDAASYHLAHYVCLAQHPIDPRYYGALSTPQLNYLYDYYRQWTIPCLNANDYPVLELPTRQQFLQLNTPFWTPYYNSSASGGEVPPTILRGRCGVVPAGLFPKEYIASLRDGQDRINGWGRYVNR